MAIIETFFNIKENFMKNKKEIVEILHYPKNSPALQKKME